MNELYPHQVNAKDMLRHNFRLKYIRQMLYGPTGMGKTEVVMSITLDAMAKGNRVTFIADRQTLVTQTSERFWEAGIKHGVAMGDSTFGRNEPIQVTSAQTLEERGFFVSGINMGDVFAAPLPNLILRDEGHDLRMGTDERPGIDKMILDSNIPTIAMSATPFREGLGEIYQVVANSCTTNELLKGGRYLCPFDVVSPEASVNPESSEDWKVSNMSGRVREIVGDVVEEWIKQCNNHFNEFVPTICFCVDVADGEETVDRFQEAGHDFRMVHYRQNAKQKQEIINRYREGKHVGLVNVRVLTKGFDAPKTKILIDAQPTKSFPQHIQKIGRLMRIAPGKVSGLLISHTDNYLAFYDAMQALFASGCHSLHDGKLENVKRKSVEEFPDIRCGECRFIMPPRSEICPSCGASKKRKTSMVVKVPGNLKLIDRVEGELGVFTGDWLTEIRKVATSIHPMEYERARKLASASYNSLFGEWPKGTFEFTYGDPHPVVKEVSRRKYQQWLIAKRKGKAA